MELERFLHLEYKSRNNMKKSILIIATLITSFVFADGEKSVDSKIKGVNVFLSRAEVNRSATSFVTSGMTDIILTNLSQNIDANSVQVSGLGDVVIMSVSHRMNYVNKALKSDKVKVLESKIKEFEEANVIVKYNKEALQEEKSMILANKSIGGDNTGVNWEQLENIADFFRERLVDISTKWTAFDKKEKENNRQLRDTRNQLKTLTTSLNKPTSEIVVKVHAKASQQVKLDFTYVVYNAGWTPLYDFRAKDGKDKIDVSFRANVYQNTGVDWKNVPLTLSTGNPTQGIVKPELNPWYLYLQEINNRYKKGKLAYGSAPTRQAESMSYDDAEEVSVKGNRSTSNRIMVNGVKMNSSTMPSQTSSNFVNTNMKQLSTEYAITLAQSIKSDNKKHMVNVKEFKVDAEFEHAAVPKLDKDAFLMANLMNWQQHDWISSEMNIFYDGTYVGRTFIDIAQVDDTLALSLGRDKKVVITRDKIKDYCKVKTIGLNKKKITGYEITVKNNKRTAIKLNLQDQLPISKQDQIEIKVNDISGAKKEDTSGFLDWEVKLKPGESKTYFIKYEVKYPRKYYIPGL